MHKEVGVNPILTDRTRYRPGHADREMTIPSSMQGGSDPGTVI